jgi:inner membrane protein
MLIAHVPAGYLLGAAAQRMAGANGRSIMLAALLGSMTPDFDMLYFHLIDGRQTHHHHYFTHWPVFWLTLALALTFVSVLLRRPRLIVVLAFSAGTLLHMVLDTIAAPILRLMPFDNRSVEMVEIPAVYTNWIWSFVFHWTFALEITICLTALALFLRRRRGAKAISAKMT